MTNQTGAPNAAAAVVTDAVGPAKAAGGRRRKVQQYDKVRGARWWREIGWRHVVGVLAVLFALFPILFVVSASLNPLGTLASTELVPTTISFDNYTRLIDGERGPFTTWFVNTLMVCGAVCVGQVFFSSLAAYAFSRFRFTRAPRRAPDAAADPDVPAVPRDHRAVHPLRLDRRRPARRSASTRSSATACCSWVARSGTCG